MILRASAAAVLALVLTACGFSNGLTGPGTTSANVIFLAQNAASSSVMDALYEGPVVLDSAGCLRLKSDERVTFIWPYGFTLAERGEELWIQDGAGKMVARVGGGIRSGGGFVGMLHAGIPMSSTDRARAAASCPGTYWVVGDILRP